MNNLDYHNEEQFHDSFLDGNEQIEAAIHECYEEPTQFNLVNVLNAVQVRLRNNGHLIIPVEVHCDEDGNPSFDFKTIDVEPDVVTVAAFTSQSNFSNAPASEALSHFMDSIFAAVHENTQYAGILLNPWGESFFLNQEMISAILAPVKEHHPYLAELDAMERPYVNAHINNISFPTDIEGLEIFIYKNGRFNVEDVLVETDTNWTVPRTAKIGDIVLFLHAKTAISRITALITKVNALPPESGHNKQLLLEWLERARQLYKQYGGKIFAVGRVTGSPEYWSAEEVSNPYHWQGRIYADIGDVVVLENPIDISEFNSFIKISRQSGITHLTGPEYKELRVLVKSKNEHLPAYYLKSEIGDFNLAHINRENFLVVTREYRRRFLLENDFRAYYVNHLFRSIVKRNFWKECTCRTPGKADCFVDNVFQYRGRFYLLEVKLNVLAEQDLKGQLKQYVYADHLFLRKELTNRVDDFEREYMYVIDTNAFYRYDTAADTLTELIWLDDVHNIRDIERFLQ